MITDTAELLELSDAVTSLADKFNGFPPMQAMLHGAFTLYLSGETGLIYLTVLAAQMNDLTCRAIAMESTDD